LARLYGHLAGGVAELAQIFTRQPAGMVVRATIGRSLFKTTFAGIQVGIGQRLSFGEERDLYIDPHAQFSQSNDR
jgi:hypothetical protein